MTRASGPMSDQAQPAQQGPPRAPAPEREAPALSAAFAQRHGVLVDGQDAHGWLRVLCRATPAPDVLAELRRFLDQPFSLVAANPGQFEQRLQAHYAAEAGQAAQAADGLDEEPDLTSAAQALPDSEELLEAGSQAPVIRLINALLAEGVRRNASDIHIEPYESRVRVRLRLDGVLTEVLSVRRSLAPFLVSRIKVMARLDIAEKRLPQDGRIAFRIAGRPIDVRVATLPGAYGERVVLRLLDKETGQMDLPQLGLPARDFAALDEMIHKPHGIVLVTGPTGSGKTTTLYAALTRLNDQSRNMLTVEDPIEYYLEGIGQTQVNTKAGLTFANALRALLRQDPDVVMIGEIRDRETAEIAVQASLTGHLVLSTLHTNTAVGAITRLRDMEVAPFLLASTLSGVMAQRLVRRLCPTCKQARPVTDAGERALLGIAAQEPAPTIYDAVGCPACNQTGYQGRLGIYELVQVDERLQRLIHDEAGEDELAAAARAQTASLRNAGLQRVLDGVTSLAEVLRVTREA